MKVAEKLGVTQKEIDKLCDAIITALENGPLDPDGLREATGKAVGNLGPEGQKKGLTTTLPMALGKLQSSGVIRRIPTNGRLDQQRYKYSLWRPNHCKISRCLRRKPIRNWHAASSRGIDVHQQGGAWKAVAMHTSRP